jgi:hypothetical protein
MLHRARPCLFGLVTSAAATSATRRSVGQSVFHSFTYVVLCDGQPLGHLLPIDSIWLHNGRVPANDRTKQLPSHVVMAWPTLRAIKRAGGSASNAEILEAVAVDLNLTDEQRAVLRGRGGTRTLLEYRLAWARTFLKNMGAIAYDAPCQWSITEIGQETTPEDIENFKKKMLDKLAEYSRNKRASADPS